MLPGPVIMSTGARSAPSVSVPPYASSPIPWAPPTAHTSSTPSRRAAARIVGCGSPPKRACGGVATTRDPTPAIWAGTTFITTLDGYTALPPGTYSPTLATATQRSVTVAPGPSVVVVSTRR